MPKILFEVGKTDVFGQRVIISEQIFQQRFVRYAEFLIVSALKEEFPELKLTPRETSGFNNPSIYLRYDLVIPDGVNLEDVIALFINELQRYSWLVIQHGILPQTQSTLLE